MKRRIHLATVVGSRVPVLRHMLRHYRELGISSIYVNVIAGDASDPLIAEVADIADIAGATLASVNVGSWQELQRSVWRKTMERHPDDWFILADQDEFQVYPCDLEKITEDCEAVRADYVSGCQIDRLCADGSFPPPGLGAIWDQYPLGSMLTYTLLRGSPRKVVLTKGHVTVTKGQHLAITGVRCPPERYFIPVHHFKWTDGVIQELEKRVATLRDAGVDHWIESENFLRHVRKHGNKIHILEPGLAAAPCRPAYPLWSSVVEQLATNWPKPGATWV